MRTKELFTASLVRPLALLALLALLPMARAQTDVPEPLAVLVETVTGESVPRKNNSITNHTSDMVKICDVRIGGRFLFVCTYYSTTICVFERDPATAKLTFRDSFENPHKSHWHWANLYTRELPGGDVVLYYHYKGALHWYNVDGKTGAAAEAGKIEKAGGPPAVFSPDGKRMLTPAATLALDARGTPSVEKARASKAVAMAFAPDGKHLYEAMHSRVSVLSYDPASGDTAEVSALDLTGQADTPKPGRTFMSLSPDGRFLYVGQVSEGYGAKKKWFSWMLERNLETGALAVKSSGVPPRDLTNAESCLFRPDGKAGYFIQADPVDGEGYRSCAAWFSRDAETGVMTFHGKGPAARTCCMDYDAVHGNFYAGSCGQGPKDSHIFVFRTPAAPQESSGR